LAEYGQIPPCTIDRPDAEEPDHRHHCARAASGHAATPPRRLMNSRRRISAPKLRDQHCIGSNEYFDRAQTTHQNHCAVHSQCRRWVMSPEPSNLTGPAHVRRASGSGGILCSAADAP
jgi:hypothetical protein